ncbi:MAG: prenyltransferase/squalene oxidase repeat-containing protein [Planctomycetota bacterium]
MHPRRNEWLVRVLVASMAAGFMPALWASAQNSSIHSPAHRRAIERSIELLRGSVDRYPSHRDCFSCHHQALPLFAFRSAVRPSEQKNGRLWGNDEERAEQILQFSRKSLETSRDALQRGEELDGRGLTLGYALWTSDIGRADWGELQTDLINNALATQQTDGRWRVHSTRPPAGASDAMATALVVSGLCSEIDALSKEQGTEDRQSQLESAVWRAKCWMLMQPEPRNTEDACGMLWLQYLLHRIEHRPSFGGLGSGPPGSGFGFSPSGWQAWLERNSSEEEAKELLRRNAELSLHMAEKRLRSKQHEDGGWGQDADRESDAYSTAMVLLLLAEVSMDYKVGAYAEPYFKKGIEYLIRTQREDGSWHVSSRAIPVQEYFDNGDPHETDQFISIMATGWSTAALASALHHRIHPLSFRR